MDGFMQPYVLCHPPYEKGAIVQND